MPIAQSWAIFGFAAAGLSAAQMLLQERFKTAPFAMAFWGKAGCALVMLPFVIAHGLPDNWYYYLLLTAQSLLWVVSDVIFYRSISESGAGVISRILPISTIASFFLWFAIDWPSASTYIATPWHSLAIIIVLSLSAFCASELKKCPVTMAAFRKVWFVLLAAIIGTVSTKYISQQAAIKQGVYAYVFCEALIMMAVWLLYYAVKPPLLPKIMFSPSSIKSGVIVGSVSAFAVAATVYAVYNADNPAYVSAIRYLDAVMILGFYRLTRRPDPSRIWAGLGIVACAAILIILKAT